jgi:type VI secretion system protein ImpM
VTTTAGRGRVNIHGALNLETFDAPFVEPTTVLDEDISKVALEEKLSAVTRPGSAGSSVCRVSPGSVVACAPTNSHDLFATTTAALLARSFHAPTIWSTLMEGDNRLMVCDGLPDGSNMQGLFDLDADLWREGIL